MRLYQFGKIALPALALTIAAAGSASAAGCTIASLKGAYGSLGTGFSSAGNPAAGMFQITADGAGNVTGTGFLSVDGTYGSSPITGTYTVAKNCTGKFTFKDKNNVVDHQSFVLDNVRKGFQLIGTDAGQVSAGYGLAFGAGTCGLTGKAATFAVNVTGTDIGTGPLAVVGRVTLDGKGNVSGSATFDRNGTVTSEKITGSYTAKSDCTGTIIAKDGRYTSNLATVEISGGKGLLLLETDSKTVVWGSLQQ